MSVLRFEELPKVNTGRWLSVEDLIGEIWKDVPEYKGIITVSNYSRVYDMTKKKICKQYFQRDGYGQVVIKINGKYKHLCVHRLVASAFLPNIENRLCVDHIDTNKANNTVTNLRWVTHKENCNNILTKEHIKEDRKNRRGGVYSRKRIAKVDMQGNVVCVYESASEAALKNNISIGSISNSAHYEERKGRYKLSPNPTVGGFYWKYIN